eukprot:9486300-Pyramimonas_sp.AAC.1
MDVHVVHVEEFVLVARGRVGILLRHALGKLWEEGGRQLHWEEGSDRLLAVVFSLYARRVACVSNYSPTGATVGPRRDHYRYARCLSSRLGSEVTQLWGGDFNGHICSNDGDGKRVGTRGLGAATTM